MTVGDLIQALQEFPHDTPVRTALQWDPADSNDPHFSGGWIDSDPVLIDGFVYLPTNRWSFPLDRHIIDKLEQE
jgi:hypothetical protein